MGREKSYVLLAGVCLLFSVAGIGQTLKPAGRAGDSPATVARVVEPDSPATISPAAAQSQANGASPGTIVPRLMKFSGALHDATGKPLTGTMDVTFSLYNTEAGGEPLWFETQSVQADDLGRYTALLGAMHTDGLPVELFTSGEVRWLGIQVGVEPEQQPRVLLVSVPYALKAGDAETLGGKPASAFVLADTQSGTATSVTTTSATGSSAAGTKGAAAKGPQSNVLPLTPVCSGVTSAAGGTVGSIALFDATCDIQSSVITQSSNNIGVGTGSPAVKLHVVDNANPFQFEVDTSNANGASIFLNQTGQTNGGKYLRSYNGLFQVINSAYSDAIMTMQDGGNVGIGTWSPAVKLHLADDTNQIQLELQSANASGANIYLNQTGSPNGGKYLRSYNGLFQVINSAYSDAIMTMQDGGNVGIGTWSPTAKLEVNGTAKATAFVGDGSGLTNLSATGLMGGIMVQSNSTSPNIIAGFNGNTVGGSVLGATISGGGASGNLNSITLNYGTIGGGALNTINGTFATIGGGFQNTASGSYATVGGGTANTASGSNASIVGGGTTNTAFAINSTIGGGGSNFTGDTLQSDHSIGANSTVGGGSHNSASGNYSTIPGGDSNTTGASADHSFAAGFGAVANFTGDFVWADNVGLGTETTFTSTAANQFLIRASGGVGIGTTSPTAGNLDVNGGIQVSTATAQPTCNATQRGTFWVVQGGTGVKDNVQVCAKDATNTYAWRVIY